MSSLLNKNKDSFEENIELLEAIVRKLEGGKLSLDESLNEFQKGIELYKSCSEYLNKADGEIKAIIKNNEIDFNLDSIE